MKLRKQAIREALPIIIGVLILCIAMGELNQWKRAQELLGTDTAWSQSNE